MEESKNNSFESFLGLVAKRKAFVSSCISQGSGLMKRVHETRALGKQYDSL